MQDDHNQKSEQPDSSIIGVEPGESAAETPYVDPGEEAYARREGQATRTWWLHRYADS